MEEVQAKIQIHSESTITKGLKNDIKLQTYLIVSQNEKHSHFRSINIVDDQMHLGDNEFRFYDANLNPESEEEVQELPVVQYFPADLIKSVILKQNCLGYNFYLMRCVNSPMFLHRQKGVAKISIDFKTGEIKWASYHHYFKEDLMAITINTTVDCHYTLMNMKSLKLLCHHVKKGSKEPLIAAFIAQGRCAAVDSAGRFYLMGKRVFSTNGGNLLSLIFSWKKQNFPGHPGPV